MGADVTAGLASGSLGVLGCPAHERQCGPADDFLVDVANQIDASGLSPERQARLLIDVARAHIQRRHAGEAIAALLDAERLTPEHVRSHHLAKTAISDLLDHFGRRPPAELIDLARRSGATP